MAGVESALADQRPPVVAAPADRVVSTAGGLPMLLDDFPLTRLLEIAVHSADLALGADIPTPATAPHVFEPILDLLARLAVVRYGQVAVLRALSRAECASAVVAGI
ncbi:hypothetical protein [Nocardia sp. alder85J]|uniref:hypothetical protein n=1 Tax=Nocardia sp. alder85J TaxID=2862949 RepID=UPI001CD3756B|nr:hypothetical protein [Nocardia sp. alder85J]MCX4094991.1 hypothetical protein [Nocardia sp. alder85J]